MANGCEQELGGHPLRHFGARPENSSPIVPSTKPPPQRFGDGLRMSLVLPSVSN